MQNAMEIARYNMIHQQIRPFKISDNNVVKVLETVNRLDFVPEAYRAQAYFDTTTPLACGQCMLEPKGDASILQTLSIKPTDKILEIGTGSGYLTACLAAQGQHVFSIELHQTLTEIAQKNLDAQNIQNITLSTEDALKTWNDDEQYDVIAFTGSTQIIDDNWKTRLKQDGRLLIFVGTEPAEGVLITCTGPNQYTYKSMFDLNVPPLQETDADSAFIF